MNSSLCSALSCAFGPSGCEDEAAELVRSFLPFPTQKDSLQNVYAPLPGNHGAPMIMLDAHLDEVGFMIQSVTANGLLHIVPIGGWVEHNVPAHTFLIRTRNGKTVRAISTSKPPHFLSAAERSAPLDINNILLDAGVTSREEAAALGLEAGLFVIPEAEFSFCEETGTMIGKAFDCRLGCAALLECMQTLQNETLAVDVTAVFSSQEEVGSRGARVAARCVAPRLAICLEGTPADDTFTSPELAQGVVKKGVQLRFRDTSMVAHPHFMEFARTVAEKSGVSYQLAVRTGGGTNGGMIHMESRGIPTIVLGIPVRYAHTHFGVSALCDVEAASKLCVEIIRSLTPEIVDELNPVVEL